MKLKRLLDDTGGGLVVETSLTMAFFLALTFGLVQAGLLLFTVLGLQHGVEMAARCASVNYSANQLGLTQIGCFGVAPSAVSVTTIQQYAAQNSLGIAPSSGTFQIDCPDSVVTTSCHSNTNTCGTRPGYQVSVSNFNPLPLINYIFSAKLSASSCFPVNNSITFG